MSLEQYTTFYPRNHYSMILDMSKKQKKQQKKNKHITSLEQYITHLQNTKLHYKHIPTTQFLHFKNLQS
jgi:hypothetical protein